MKRFLVALALSIPMLALAQTSGPDLYNKARLAHGEAALNGLKTLKTVGQFTIPGSNSTMTQVSLFDFERNLYRLEVKAGSTTSAVFRVTPSEAKQWTNGQAVKNIDASTLSALRYGALEGVLAIRATTSSWSSISVGNSTQLAGQSGTALNLGNGTQATMLLLGTDGSLLAQKITANNRDVDIAFSDYKTTSGLKFPYLLKQYENGQSTTQIKYSEIIVNPTLTDANFALPQ
jgi:hypothetical protein